MYLLTCCIYFNLMLFFFQWYLLKIVSRLREVLAGKSSVYGMFTSVQQLCMKVGLTLQLSRLCWSVHFVLFLVFSVGTSGSPLETRMGSSQCWTFGKSTTNTVHPLHTIATSILNIALTWRATRRT